MSTKKGKRLNDIQHCLLRPDKYIGSIENVKSQEWIWDPEINLITLVKIVFNRGLYKCIEEVISNAIDIKWRTFEFNEKLAKDQKKGKRKDESPIDMKKIIIDVDQETNYISVQNDGLPIPIRKETYDYEDPTTKKITSEEMYPAELYFGYMKAGTNFDDDEGRKTSGRNGVGSKAPNIFGKDFIVEHTNQFDGKKFIQEYKDNMSERTVPKITPYKKKEGYTKITFLLDFERFKYKGIDDNLFNLLKKAAYDCAMITKLTVVFNGEKIKIDNLSKYVELYYNKKDHNMIHFENGDQECVLVEVENNNKNEMDTIISTDFVNGIFCRKGGIQVDAWCDVIIAPIVKAFNAKFAPKKPKGKKPVKKVVKSIKASAKQVYPYFVLFTKCELENPAFESQTKDYLTKPKPSLSKMTSVELKKIMKWDFVKKLEEKLVNEQGSKVEKKQKGPLTLGSRYKKANWSDSPDVEKRRQCILILTEGDSAQKLANAGIASIGGHDIYGTFAQKGKGLNTEKHSQDRTDRNKEVQYILSIIGAVRNVDYSIDENFETLNYIGGVQVYSDADDDGIHIRGLDFNMFYGQVPSLWEREGFFTSRSSAVVKITDSKNKTLQLFYANPAYEKFKLTDEYDRKMDLRTKYMKGLGSMNSRDAAENFQDPKILIYNSDSKTSKYMRLGFGGNDTDVANRKIWITKDLPTDDLEKITNNKIVEDSDVEIEDEGDSDVEIEINTDDCKSKHILEKTQDYIYEGELSLSKFIDKQLIIYHIMALSRGIPSVQDGFKMAIRKIFYGIDRKNPKKTMPVEKLMGVVSDFAAYHHGAKSLEGTTARSMQGFVGSNNIPLLVNDGMSGDRTGGPSLYAAARYLLTKLEDIYHIIYRKEDKPILDYNYEGDDKIEPKFYLPIIPMILINPRDGIACGFSSTLYAYNPEDLVERIKSMLSEGFEALGNFEPLKPWYRGFTGEIELKVEKKVPVSWTSKGRITEIDDVKQKGWYLINELPIGLWTDNMKEYIESLMNSTLKNKKTGKTSTICAIKNYVEYNTPNTVHFEIKPGKDFNLKTIQKKLIRTEKFTNMVLLNRHGYPVRYKTVEDILKEFYIVRLEGYHKRKAYQLSEYKKKLNKDENKEKFITAVAEKKLDLTIEEEVIIKKLEKMGIDKLAKESKKGSKANDVEDNRDEDEEEIDTNLTYDYLLDMPNRKLNKNEAQKLKDSIKELKKTIKELQGTKVENIWLKELEEFEKAYKKFNKTRQDNVDFPEVKKKLKK